MQSTTRHFDELQSMRGLAALLVVLGHCIGIFKYSTGPMLYVDPFLNGAAAVAFFFVLSGTVLAMSWKTTPVTGSSYVLYLTKRAFRIMPLLIVVAIVGLIWCNYLDVRATYAFAKPEFTEHYKADIDLPRFVASLVGYSARPAPPLWSIFIELVGSIVIPLIIVASRRPILMLPLGLVLLALGWWGAPGFQYRWPVFLINFYLGVTILSWGPAYGRMVARLPRALVLAAVVAGLVLFLGNRYWWPTGHGAFSSNLIEMAVSAQLIAIAIYVPDMFPALRSRALVFIGDISYSIYLIHFLIMVATLQLLARLVPPETMAASPAGYALLLAALVSLITIGVSTLTYRLIEMPLTVMGKQLISHGQVLHGRVRRRFTRPVDAVAAAGTSTRRAA